MNLSKLLFWGIFILASALALTSLVAEVVPFFIAFIIAYILDPIITRHCSRYNISRTLAASIVFIIFLGFFVIITSVLIPMIYHQISILVSKIPAYRDYIQDEITPFLTRKLHSLEPNVANKISDSIQNFINSSLSFVSIILNNLWHSALTTINTVAFTLLVPIILFYLLRDWPGIKSHLYDLLPLKHRDYIVRIIKDISSILSAYIGGQLNICLILAIIYSIGLSLIGIDLSLLVGFLSGFFIIIPFVGILLAFSIAIILGYLTFGFTIKLTYILALYATCFLLEGYFLTPKIIGDKIGLHPIWIMFSVFASGAVFGFIGIFFAIPIAGIIKVLLGYAIEWYKSSSFYTS